MTELDEALMREPPGKDLEGLRALAGIRARLFGRASPALCIGRYVLGERLGAGGLGVVYAAHDPQLDREVAIKLLRNASTTERAREDARLLREARAMARLSHPNVVEVFDVGTYDEHEGLDLAERPRCGVFIVMARLEGETLERWLARELRPWRAVLERFMAAGRGLAAAHAAGLIHRDFKPANVFVEHDGQVKVLDFGLARGHGSASATTLQQHRDTTTIVDPLRSVTMAGAILGTPAYMAPEQHHAGTVDGRSDQYGFCAALYHGLCGVLPFAGPSLDALVDQKQRVPRPPVAGLVPRWLWKVVRRGLAPDPVDRWRSMPALLRALEHGARSNTRSLVLAGGVTGALAVAWLAAPATGDGCDEPASGLAWSDDMRAAVASSLEVHEAGARALPKLLPRLDAHAMAWTEEQHDICEAALSLPTDAEIDLRRGCLQRVGVRFDALVTVLTQADERVAERAAAAVTSLEDPARCRDVEEVRADLGPEIGPMDAPAAEALRAGLAEVSALVTAGRFDQALVHARLHRQEALVLAHPPLLAEATWWEGHAQRLAGELEPALPRFEQAFHGAVASGHDKIAALAAVELATTLGALARYEPALEWSRHAEAAALRYGEDRYPLARAYASQGTVLRQLGRLEQAHALFEAALRGQQRADASSHELPTILNNLGTVALLLGRNEEALEHYERSYARLLELLGATHPQTVAARMNLGIVTAALGREDEAQGHYTGAREAFVTLFGDSDARVAYCDTNLGNLLLDQGNIAAARDRFAEARDVFAEALGATHPNTATARAGWALAQLKLGHPALAREALEQALNDMREAVGSEHPQVAVLMGHSGQALLAEGHVDAAREQLELALAMLERTQADPNRVLEARFHLARVRWAAGKHAIAWSQAHATLDALDVHAARATRQEVEAWLAAHPRP